MNSYRAIVIGGTGAVGSSLVRELLASSLCEQVTAVVRQDLPEDKFEDPDCKLRVSVVNMDHLGTEAIAPARGCSVAFSTMGIGQPSKVSKDQFWKVDVEYNLAFARACKLVGVSHFSLLSSVGANVNSHFHYLHVKGAVEERLGELGFPRVSLFRPGLLVTREIRYGLKDRVTQTLYPLFSPILSSKYREIKVEDLGRAMRINAERDSALGVESFTYPEFQKLLALDSQK